MNGYLNNFLTYLRNKNYSENTVRNYAKDILEFEGKCKNLLDPKLEEIDKYLEFLNNNDISKSSMARKVSSLKSFYKYLVLENEIQDSPFSFIKIPKKDKNLPHYLTEEEVIKVIEVANRPDYIGKRDNLIIELLYATGIRVSELVTIKLEDINKDDQIINIHGKGNKMRIVVYGSYCKRALDIYLKEAYDKLNKKNSKYLILNKNGGVLTDRYVREIIYNLVRKAQIKKHVSPHTIRHSMATHLLNRGSDLVSVKELLGHESLNTTSIYTHVTTKRLKEVYEFAHPRAKKL